MYRLYNYMCIDFLGAERTCGDVVDLAACGVANVVPARTTKSGTPRNTIGPLLPSQPSFLLH